MSNTNQNDRHVEILASSIHCTEEFLLGHPKETIVTPHEALTAMQRAVEEEINHLRQSAQIFLTSYEEAQSELTTLRSENSALQRFRMEDAANAIDDSNAMHANFTNQIKELRTELERVRGVSERIKQLNRYHIDVEDYGDDGCSLAVDIDKEGQWVGYDDIIETLEGGGDEDKRTPCNNCQGGGCPVCGGSGYWD
jgi:DNA repair exonuclease SbcCD ATPase subunit